MANNEIKVGATVQCTNSKGRVLTGTVVATYAEGTFDQPRASVLFERAPHEPLEIRLAYDDLTVITPGA